MARTKLYRMTFSFEVVVNATDPGSAEAAARALASDLETRYHLSRKHQAAVEAGFTFNDDVEEIISADELVRQATSPRRSPA